MSTLHCWLEATQVLDTLTTLRPSGRVRPPRQEVLDNYNKMFFKFLANLFLLEARVGVLWKTDGVGSEGDC